MSGDPRAVERGRNDRDDTSQADLVSSPRFDSLRSLNDPQGDVVDVVVVGGGPAGLSAALNLGRARATVVVVDADRPRNAATLRSHGFLTRDGIPPQELRRLARAELEAYPNVRILSRTRATTIHRGATTGENAAPDSDHSRQLDDTDMFRVQTEGRGGAASISARAVLVATGLRETLPDVPNIRGFYGMSLFSCAACDAWELQDRPLALIGETGDLAARARLIARWTHSLSVFTNGADTVDAADEAELAASGVRVERAPIVELEGDRGAITGIRLADGTAVAVEGGFVRPVWTAALEFLEGVDAYRDEHGHLVVDRSGRTNVPGLYAAGDAAAPGPQQLIVAAGQGARAAAVIVHDLVGVVTAH
ncbi:NAD(P)/FAD-dependent oxidoreductase [Microbacterium sp. ASV49]|uniref:NAD(P)/FAD-dependent oxidoreductase n=1 Tax=Microbacterium candidum TaxID=3041922 RepID=A0ABT7MTK5_9MICO|nr:NAD(P)/FAD-dependent oxidoreductase [Microbacterium sp. ASV49]MDL9977776.1 NAD(P)/FAD-dependent oxidoreductase [Microbacterium sp. ASV49]